MTAYEISCNVSSVFDRVAEAARSAGRDPSEITVVAASKMNSAENVRSAIEAGIKVCGENRVQEMLEKNALHAYDGADLHFIGHLQKNKVKNVVGLVSLIHSIDSLALLDAVSKTAEAHGIVQDVLLEVNIGNEASKSGFSPSDISSVLRSARLLQGVRIRGLMAIPPICEDPEANAPFFTLMKQLFIDNSEKKYDNSNMDFLSMGMSNDFVSAIRCGSNMIRIGSAVFGPRDYGSKP